MYFYSYFLFQCQDLGSAVNIKFDTCSGKYPHGKSDHRSIKQTPESHYDYKDDIAHWMELKETHILVKICFIS